MSQGTSHPLLSIPPFLHFACTTMDSALSVPLELTADEGETSTTNILEKGYKLEGLTPDPSTESLDTTFPEGGLRAWLTITGVYVVDPVLNGFECENSLAPND